MYVLSQSGPLGENCAFLVNDCRKEATPTGGQKIFFLSTLAFAHGTVMFGSLSLEFSASSRSTMTCWRTLLGTDPASVTIAMALWDIPCINASLVNRGHGLLQTSQLGSIRVYPTAWPRVGRIASLRRFSMVAGLVLASHGQWKLS
jgi:hypothetical protein